MNSLDDLRSTLEGHSHSTAGIDDVARARQLKERITVTQRRRNTIRTGVGALAVVAVIGGGFALANLGTDDSTPGPANTTFGAPQHFSAAGWNYAFADAVKTDDTSTISLEASKYTRLLSWKTDGTGQDVTVTSTPDIEDAEAQDLWWSSAEDWSDYVVIPAGEASEITVSATAANTDAVTVATYEIDMTDLPAAEGADEPGQFFFRKTVEDRVLLATAITGPGESEATQEFTGAQEDLAIAFSCSGLPKKAMVYVSLDGSDEGAGSGGGCDAYNTEADPGANSQVSFPVERDQDRRGTLRVWATLEGSEDKPLTAADYPDMTLGAAVYTSTDTHEDVLGMDVSPRITTSGHEWQLVGQVPVSGGTPVRLDSLSGAEGYDGPWIVTAVQRAPEGTFSFHLEADGNPINGTYTSSASRGGTSMIGNALLAPTTASVRAVVTEGADGDYRQELVFYRLAG